MTNNKTEDLEQTILNKTKANPTQAKQISNLLKTIGDERIKSNFRNIHTLGKWSQLLNFPLYTLLSTYNGPILKSIAIEKLFNARLVALNNLNARLIDQPHSDTKRRQLLLARISELRNFAAKLEIELDE